MILLYIPPATFHKHLFGNTREIPHGLDIQQWTKCLSPPWWRIAWQTSCCTWQNGTIHFPHARPEMALGEYIIAYQFPKRIIYKFMTSSQSHQRRCYIATSVFPPSLTSLWMVITFCLRGPCLPTTCTLEISTDPSGIWSISAKTSSGVSFRGFSDSWMPSLGLCAPVCFPRGTCGRNRKMKVNPISERHSHKTLLPFLAR